jgi:hypothetical protein
MGNTNQTDRSLQLLPKPLCHLPEKLFRCSNFLWGTVAVTMLQWGSNHLAHMPDKHSRHQG